jgi:hypothetical protein
MGKISAVTTAALEFQRGLRPVTFGADVNDAIGANPIGESHPSVGDPCRDIGASVDPSPDTAFMQGDQATRAKESGTCVFDAVEHNFDGVPSRDRCRWVAGIGDHNLDRTGRSGRCTPR